MAIVFNHNFLVSLRQDGAPPLPTAMLAVCTVLQLAGTGIAAWLNGRGGR